MPIFLKVLPCFILLAGLVVSAQEKISAADVERLSSLSDQVKSALQAGDLTKAERAAQDLRSSLTRLRQQSVPSPSVRLQELEHAAIGMDEIHRFYALKGLAQAALEAGDLNKAHSYANELLSLAPQYPKNWNYGNALYYGNAILGSLAVRETDINRAKGYLLAAGHTTGSPQLNSFGPNVRLAKELLEKGERDVVLEFFSLCRSFWKVDHGLLDQWTAMVRGGGIPDFSANLLY